MKIIANYFRNLSNFNLNRIWRLPNAYSLMDDASFNAQLNYERKEARNVDWPKDVKKVVKKVVKQDVLKGALKDVLKSA